MAVLQANPDPDVDHNLARLTDALRVAANQGANVLVTPEMFLSGYDIGPERVRAAAQTIDGPLVQALRVSAASAGVALVAGWPELDRDRVYNTATLISSAGDVLTSYRKSHLYGALDRAQFSAGDALGEVVELDGVNVALAICFDIEFPEVPRALSVAGAQAILVPTANWLATVNTRLVPTRGEENGSYIVYANYSGAEGDRRYCGLSCIVDPRGDDVARLGEGEGIAVGDVDPAAVVAAREQCDYFGGLRPELYQHGSDD